MTQRFFVNAAKGLESKVLEAVKQDRNMLDLQCHLEFQVPTINDGLVWVNRGCTAMMAASSGGHSGLVKKLALLGANVHALDEHGVDALSCASICGSVPVCIVLFDHGAVVTARNDAGMTPLHFSALHANLQVGLLLCSKGADLTAVEEDGETPLQLYGIHANPPLSEETLQDHRVALLDCFRKGPHPSQVQRRKDENWARRWPFVMIMVGHDFQPLAARRAILLAANPPLPPNVRIPPLPNRTRAQRRALLNMRVFCHKGIWRIIASFL